MNPLVVSNLMTENICCSAANLYFLQCFFSCGVKGNVRCAKSYFKAK